MCLSEVVDMTDKRAELAILAAAVDELGNRGEVKITEFIRGGQLAWIKDVNITPNSVYGKGSMQSRQWWRNFICQVAPAGYINSIVKTALCGPSKGMYASLTVTDKARHAIDHKITILLPIFSPQ